MEACREQHGESEQGTVIGCHNVRIAGEIHWGNRFKSLQERTVLTAIDKQWNSLPQREGKTKCLKGVKMMTWMKVISLMVVQQ